MAPRTKIHSAHYLQSKYDLTWGGMSFVVACTQFYVALSILFADLPVKLECLHSLLLYYQFGENSPLNSFSSLSLEIGCTKEVLEQAEALEKYSRNSQINSVRAQGLSEKKIP